MSQTLSEKEADQKYEIEKFHSQICMTPHSKIPADTQIWIDKNIRPKGMIKYSDLTESNVSIIAKNNYERLRWFHGTPDKKNVASILSAGLMKDHGDLRLAFYNFLTKSFRFAKLFGDGKKENVLRVFLNPASAKLFNMYQENNLKIGKTADDISNEFISTQDHKTIGFGADELFHIEMSHDAPGISIEQSRRCLRRYGSFSKDWQEPKGWTPLNGTYQPYTDDHDDG